MAGTIRLATEADSTSIQRIYRAAIEHEATSFETEVPSIEDLSQRIATTLVRTPWLAYDEQGEVLGYAYASRHRDRAAYQWSVEVSAYVDRRAHGARNRTRALQNAVPGSSHCRDSTARMRASRCRTAQASACTWRSVARPSACTGASASSTAPGTTWHRTNGTSSPPAWRQRVRRRRCQRLPARRSSRPRWTRHCGHRSCRIGLRLIMQSPLKLASAWRIVKDVDLDGIRRRSHERFELWIIANDGAATREVASLLAPGTRASSLAPAHARPNSCRRPWTHRRWRRSS